MCPEAACGQFGTGRMPPEPVPRRVGSAGPCTPVTRSIIVSVARWEAGRRRHRRSIDPIMSHAPHKRCYVPYRLRIVDTAVNEKLREGFRFGQG